MSSVKYKRTKFDDESPLAFNDEITTQSEVIEMQENKQSSSAGRTENSIKENEDCDGDICEEVPPTQIIYKKRRMETIFLAWAVVVTFFLVIFIIIAIYAHPKKRDISWCTSSSLQHEKCENMSFAFYSGGFAPRIDCVLTYSMEECVQKIDTDLSDVMVMSSIELYKYRDILKPIMAEDYALKPADGFGSYMVAVVSHNSSFNLNNSTDIKACMMNLNFTAGYYAQTIKSTNPSHLPNTCDVRFSFQSLFKSICAPSEKLNLCKGCNQNVCSHSRGCKDMECLAKNTISCFHALPKNKGIAFVDHLTVMRTLKDYTKYSLLCPDGSRQQLSSYKECNFGYDPPNSMVVSSKLRSGIDVEIPGDIVELLHIAQLYYGPNGIERFNMFSSPHGESSLFKKYSRKLVPLKYTCSSKDFLGLDYLNIQASSQCKNISQAKLPSCLFTQYS